MLQEVAALIEQLDWREQVFLAFSRVFHVEGSRYCQISRCVFEVGFSEFEGSAGIYPLLLFEERRTGQCGEGGFFGEADGDLKIGGVWFLLRLRSHFLFAAVEMLVEYAVVLLFARWLSLLSLLLLTIRSVELVQCLLCPFLELPRGRLHRGQFFGGLGLVLIEFAEESKTVTQLFAWHESRKACFPC